MNSRFRSRFRRRLDDAPYDVMASIARQLFGGMRTARAREAPVCQCDECRLARAHDVTPEGHRRPELGISTEALEAILNLAKQAEMSAAVLEEFSFQLFQKVPALLTMREAAAVIHHLKGEA